jgi:hypothetical protein
MLSSDGGNTPPITREDLPRGENVAVYHLHNIRQSPWRGKVTDTTTFITFREMDQPGFPRRGVELRFGRWRRAGVGRKPE